MQGGTMKRWLLPVLGVLLVCAPVPGALSAATDPLTVRVGAYENPPKIFTDENGVTSGFWPDIVAYIAEQENWRVEYVRGSWTECLERLESGEIDMMPDVAYTVERSQLYVFPEESVYTSWSMVYVREGSAIQSVLDLEGKTVAVLKGSVNVEGPNGIKEMVKAFNVTCTFDEVGSYGEVFTLVANGYADAGVVSKDHGYQHSAEFGLVETPIIFQPSQLYFAFPKEGELTPHLIAVTDQRIRELRESPGSLYYQSLAAWFAQEPISHPSWSWRLR
jgi:ABC-type amino acid transport substrate-binding protein